MQRSRTASISRREFIGAVGAGFVWSAEQARATFPKSTDTSTELIFISATKLAQSIRDKKATSLEVVRAHLAQIEKVNPKLNAVVQLCAERALAEARESDALLARGQVKGSSGSFEERAQEPLPMPEFADLLERQDAVGSKLLQWMKSYDIVLSPAAGKPAQPIDSPSPPVKPGSDYTRLHNSTGWPVAVVRAGTSPEGLPIGVQVVGQPWRENVVLAACEYLEAKTGGWQKPSI